MAQPLYRADRTTEPFALEAIATCYARELCHERRNPLFIHRILSDRRNNAMQRCPRSHWSSISLYVFVDQANSEGVYTASSYGLSVSTLISSTMLRSAQL